MTVEERVKALEEEAATANKEIRQALLDIRAFIMEAETPLKDQSGTGQASKDVKEGAGKEKDRDGSAGRTRKEN